MFPGVRAEVFSVGWSGLASGTYLSAYEWRDHVRNPATAQAAAERGARDWHQYESRMSTRRCEGAAKPA